MDTMLTQGRIGPKKGGIAKKKISSNTNFHLPFLSPPSLIVLSPFRWLCGMQLIAT
jgi:hypothetical protein